MICEGPKIVRPRAVPWKATEWRWSNTTSWRLLSTSCISRRITPLSLSISASPETEYHSKHNVTASIRKKNTLVPWNYYCTINYMTTASLHTLGLYHKLQNEASIQIFCDMMQWLPDNTLRHCETRAQQHSVTSQHTSIIRINAVNSTDLPYTVSCFLSQSKIHILHTLRNITGASAIYTD